MNPSNFSITSHCWQPQWPAIEGVQALMTTRHGGVSQAPWDSLNLGQHVGDDPQAVDTNRALLRQVISAQAGQAVTPVFLQQVHGCDVLDVAQPGAQGSAVDACVTAQAGVACTIMVADCLPVLLAHRQGRMVGAAHAGWRGLAGTQGVGVLEQLWQHYAQQLGVDLTDTTAVQALLADTQWWLGPCIGPQAFEVGEEVRQAFVAQQAQAAACFRPGSAPSKWMSDLAGLARLRLQALGVPGQQIWGNDSSASWCTHTQSSTFFSHRRDAGVLGSTGRMAACIWKQF